MSRDCQEGMLGVFLYLWPSHTVSCHVFTPVSFARCYESNRKRSEMMRRCAMSVTWLVPNQERDESEVKGVSCKPHVAMFFEVPSQPD